MGVSYDTGEGAEKSDKEAVRWYLQAADQGHADAQYCLGFAYETGEGAEKSDKEAVRWYRQAADQGKAAAQLV